MLGPMHTTRRIWRRIVPRSVRRVVRGPVAGASPTRGTARASSSGRAGPGAPGGLNRLHVGCGPHNLMDDWWNIDIRGFPGVDQVADVTEPWPWRDLDYVYGEHFLEHLSLEGAIRFLAQAAGALRADGRIRMSTPGLEWVWRTHFDPSTAEAEQVAATYKTNRAFYGWGHQFLYSRPMLEHILEGAGFTDLTFHRFGESDDPALRGLERHGAFEVVDSWPNVWIVEATPGGTRASDTLLAEADLELERYRRSGH
jgi:predicted SAM-dependent methyltransferase